MLPCMDGGRCAQRGARNIAEEQQRGMEACAGAQPQVHARYASRKNWELTHTAEDSAAGRRGCKGGQQEERQQGMTAAKWSSQFNAAAKREHTALRAAAQASEHTRSHAGQSS